MADQKEVVETLERVAHRKRVQQAVIGASLIIVLSFIAWVFVEVRATSDYLKECTTPSTEDDSHTCYEDGQKGQGKALKVLMDNDRVNTLWQICVSSIPLGERDDEAIDRCEREAKAQVEEERSNP